MKTRIAVPCIASAMLVFGASAATVERAVVRQLWPWQESIIVEYRLSGVTGPTDVSITLTKDGSPVALPSTAFDGELFGLVADGLYQARVTPPAGLLGAKVKDLGVSVVPVVPQTSTNALYRIYNLVDGTCEEVSAGSIASGQRGEWHWANTDAAHLVPGAAAPEAMTNIVWTGFNTDDKYKTTHLVMRYLPAKNAKVNLLNRNDKKGTIAYNYWMAVYEITQSQWTRIHGTTPSFATAGATRPASNIKYDDIRGAKGGEGEEAKYYWPNDPDPDSFLGKLRTKTGGVKFDLPWQALWEYAAQVNSGWARSSDFKAVVSYNNNAPIGTPNGLFVQDDGATSWASDPNYPGTYKGNSSTYAVVGSYSPSMIGLYDMHGNVSEFCVDWSNGYVTQGSQTSLVGEANVDLSDYTMMRAWDTERYPGSSGVGTARFYTGSNFATLLKSQTPNYTRSSANPSVGSGATVGFRVVIVED